MHRKIPVLAALLCAINLSSLEKPVTVFCHGIIDNQHQVQNYLNRSIFGKIYSFDFPDTRPHYSWDLNGLISRISSLFGRSTLKPFGKQVNRDQMFMGQDLDIVQLKEALQKQSDKKLILYGVSRGASTIVSHLGQIQDAKNIQAIVLESPAADMLDGIANFSAKLGIPLPQSLFRLIFYRYPEHPYTPVTAVSDIANRDLPIFIIYTREDTTVHPAQSWILYKAFKEKGFKNVYIQEVKTGRHCNLHLEKTFETDYCEPIKAFYNAHARGKFSVQNITLYNLQPSIEQAKEKIIDFNRKRELLYQENVTRNIHAALLIALISLSFAYFSKK